jgi:hypothetical protein
LKFRNLIADPRIDAWGKTREGNWRRDVMDIAIENENPLVVKYLLTLWDQNEG